MKTFNQDFVADLIGKKQSTISKYLTGKLDISLRDAKKVEPHMPMEVFLDANLQRMYFGKVYLQDNNSNKASNTSSQQGIDDGKPKV